jgi:cytochrome c peroxidase
MGKSVSTIILPLLAAAIAAGVVDLPRHEPARSLDEAPIMPIPTPPAVPPAKLRLGEALFNDVRLSGGSDLACASCHQLDRGGADGLDRPQGSDGRALEFNSPTVLNAVLSFRFNWRGNFRTLEAQNEAVLLDPRLMNTGWDELLAKLRADAKYRRDFQAIYGTAPERGTVLDALGAYQQSLLTPNARFDRYLRGERDAITHEEENGYRLFEGLGCIACHQGTNVGGNLFQRFGIFDTSYLHEGEISDGDLGRFAITGEPSDRHVFRVPSLRNVRLTAPYFHDGRASSLAEAVEIMGRSQLGRELAREDVDLIVRFLDTLTGELGGVPLEAIP